MHPDERNMANAIQGLNCEIPNFKFQTPNGSTSHSTSLMALSLSKGSPSQAKSRDKFLISNFQFLKECFNSHFFAYGQFPLYTGYLLVQIYHFIIGKVGEPILFEEAATSLRFLSAIASIINVFILLQIVQLLTAVKNLKLKLKNEELQLKNINITLLILIFSPYFIQFAHFGTTEALLMLFYSLIIYHSLQFINKSKWKVIFFLSLFSGLAMATKVSATLFLALPVVAFISNIFNQNSRKLQVKSRKSRRIKLKLKKAIFSFLRNMLQAINYTSVFLLLTGFFSILFSPHNLISFKEFLGSMNYESGVAFGDARVFYTRQFEYTIPFLFQAVKIFPYALGLPHYILAILGFFLLSWRKRQTNLLRLAFLIYFIPNAVLYAKWTRFMTPILPVMSIFAVLLLHTTVIPYLIRNLYKFFWIPVFAGITIIIILPGIAYLSIYQNPDVRFIASKWIYESIPKDSYILYETANVVDVPIPSYITKSIETKDYRGVSFNYYDIDNDSLLREEFFNHLAKADYIFIPSRRVFANHTCFRNIKYQILNIKYTDQLSNIKEKKNCNKLEEKYPLLNDYYQKLFSGELGFKKVAEFSSYPKITFFGKTLFEFPDEEAEETFTVFDHPVIRIYKKISNVNSSTGSGLTLSEVKCVKAQMSKLEQKI
jgi:hypothetical protein